MQPFNLSRQSDFEKWADYKLSLYNDERLKNITRPVVIGADGCLDEPQKKAIMERLHGYNFAFYRVEKNPDFGSAELNRFGDCLGLQQLDANLCAREDRISVITDESATQARKHRYIPYSNRALNWHTDGYYNPQSQVVRAFILHCNQPAAIGGENGLIDPEMVYLFLRRSNPDFIRALSRPDVMRIPANTHESVCLREETSSAVFQTSRDYRSIGMRYSRRQRHIHWLEDELTQAALNELNRLIDMDADWSISLRLQAGEGIVSNNVLHCRQQYRDQGNGRRQFLRARYYNAVKTRTNDIEVPCYI